MTIPTRYVSILVAAAAFAGGGYWFAHAGAAHPAPVAARLVADFSYRSPDMRAAFEIHLLATDESAAAPRTLHMTSATLNETGNLTMSSSCVPGPTGVESILAGRTRKLTVQPKPTKSWAQVKGAEDVTMECVPFTLQPAPQGK